LNNGNSSEEQGVAAIPYKQGLKGIMWMEWKFSVGEGEYCKG